MHIKPIQIQILHSWEDNTHLKSQKKQSFKILWSKVIKTSYTTVNHAHSMTRGGIYIITYIRNKTQQGVPLQETNQWQSGVMLVSPWSWSFSNKSCLFLLYYSNLPSLTNFDLLKNSISCFKKTKQKNKNRLQLEGMLRDVRESPLTL